MPSINTHTAPANNIDAHEAAVATGNTTHNDLVDMWQDFASDGFTDREASTFIRGAVNTGRVRSYINPIWHAALNPTMPNESHQDAKFLEVLAWYIDKSSSSPNDGRLGLNEVQEALEEYGYRYLQQSTDPETSVSRLQSWKFVQKLRLIEKAIEQRTELGMGAFYPYSPREMMEIDPSSDFNINNTIDTRAEFQERVIEASYDKPVLVKYGLPYCAHCLLLEKLGAVPAVAEKYGDSMDVFKLWWNPNDPSMADITSVAREQGITSSPMFILYENGEAVKSGYGFPDETGSGLEEFLAGFVEEPAVA